MFLPYHIALFPDHKSLQFSMQLVSAYAVECELEEARRRELEQSEVERKCTSKLRSY